VLLLLLSTGTDQQIQSAPTVRTPEPPAAAPLLRSADGTRGSMSGARRQIALHRVGGSQQQPPRQQQRPQQRPRPQQHPRQQRSSSFQPVGTPGATSFDAVLGAWTRTFESIMRDPNAAARQDELLSALDSVFAVTARARASAAECQPVELAMHSTLLESLLLRKFSLNTSLDAMRRAVLAYLCAVEQQHLRAAAAGLVRARLLRAAAARPEVRDEVVQAVVETILRTCDSYPAQSVELLRVLEATAAKRQFRAAFLDRVLQMLGPSADVAAAQRAATATLTLCKATAQEAGDAGLGGSEGSDTLGSDALAAVEDLTLALARRQFSSISYCNVHTMHGPTAASVKVIDELMQVLGKLHPARGAPTSDMIRRAMAI
jgi:hypothetical protein